MLDRAVRLTMKRAVTTTATTPVGEAAKLMRRRKVGALVVTDGAQVVGILSERDVVFRVVAAGRDLRSAQVGDVMTRSPATIGPAEPLGRALLIMHERGFRHLPVVENGKLVGIVSARSALDPDLEDFTAEAIRRQHLRHGVAA